MQIHLTEISEGLTLGICFNHDIIWRSMQLKLCHSSETFLTFAHFVFPFSKFSLLFRIKIWLKMRHALNPAKIIIRLEAGSSQFGAQTKTRPNHVKWGTLGITISRERVTILIVGSFICGSQIPSKPKMTDDEGQRSVDLCSELSYFKLNAS